MEPFNTPILFLIFNRPNETKQVFETIRNLRPKQLFVAADGPRDEFENEIKICTRVKEIATNIDWQCELKTLFRPKNLGCGTAVYEAINWFFEHVEEGIILEDDCICDDSFFILATELLDKYRTDKDIMHIGAHGPLVAIRSDAAYSFIKYPLVWGWATWKRAWKEYDFHMELWPLSGQEILTSHFNGRDLPLKFWNQTFQDVFNKRINTWDYQWVFACMKNKGLSIFPHLNLVSNIGFGDNATHTMNYKHKRSAMEIGKMSFPIFHPILIELNAQVNHTVEQDIFELNDSRGTTKQITSIMSLCKRALSLLKQMSNLLKLYNAGTK